MTKLFAAIFLILCAIPAVAAQTFTWDASVGAAGYRLWCGNDGGAAGIYNVTPLFDVPTNASKTTTIAVGKYRCAMKAYRPVAAVCGTTSAVTADCSAFSNEVLATIDPPPLTPPTNLKFTLSLACNEVTSPDGVKQAICTLEQIALVPQ